MKKKITHTHIFAILFSLVIFTFFISLGVCFVRYSILHKYSDNMLAAETDFSDSAAAGTDWSKVYPFSDETAEFSETDSAEFPSEPAEESGIKKYVNLYTEKIEDLKSRVDYYTGKLIILRMKFVELNSRFNKLIGMKLISGSDDIIVMADGNLTYYPFYADVSGGAENITDFAGFVKEHGAGLTYVQLPSKVDPDNNYLPSGIEDYDNIKADSILEILRKNSIDCLDIREEMKKQDINFTDAFYRTDHHWKTQTALWAANEIAKNLEKHSINYSPELLSPDNYTEKVYKDYMLGSLGKTVTLAYTDPEDFSIFYPKFETDFTVNYYDRGEKSGSLKDSMTDSSIFEKIDYYNVSVYGSFLQGIQPITSIENKKAEGNQRVLVIGDSFSLSVIPYLSTQVRYLDKLDTRSFNGSIRSFVEKTKPDAVVIMYYPGTLHEGTDPTMRFK